MLSVAAGQVVYSEEQRKSAKPGKRSREVDLTIKHRLIKLAVELRGAGGPVIATALLDYRAQKSFIDSMLAKSLGIKPVRRG